MIGKRKRGTSEEASECESTSDKDICRRTESIYRARIEKYLSWMREKHPELLSGENVCVPRNKTEKDIYTVVVRDYLATISSKPDGEKYSYHFMNSHIAAIKYYNRTLDGFPVELNPFFAAFLQDYKIAARNEQDNAERPTGEVEAPLTLEGLKLLSSWALQESSRSLDYGMTVWPCLLISWNAIARTSDVANLKFQHISWVDDALVLMFPRTKTDLTGDTANPRYMYANTECPAINVVLALAVLVFVKGCDGDKGHAQSLFACRGQDQLGSWLRSRRKSHHEELMSLNIKPEKLGTDSLRRGCAIHVDQNPGSPGRKHVNTRAGWKNSGINERYHREAQTGSDRYVGRFCCGFDVNKTSFASLPPHFSKNEQLPNWDYLIPNFCNFPASMHGVVPYLFASLVANRNFLRSNLNSRHPFFLSTVWRSGVLNLYADKVAGGEFLNPTTDLKATGVPPLVYANQKIENLLEKLQHAKSSFLLASRSLSSDDRKRQVEETLRRTTTSTAKAVAAELRATCILNVVDVRETAADPGAVNPGAVDPDAVDPDVEEPDATDAGAINHAGVVDPGALNLGAVKMANGMQSEDPQSMYIWKNDSLKKGSNTLHRVAKTFTFPTCSVAMMWEMWFAGNPVDHVPPLMSLSTQDINDKTGRNYFTRAAKVIDKILQLSKENIDATAWKRMSSDHILRRSIFSKGFSELCAAVYPGHNASKMERRSTNTVHKDISALNCW